MMKNKEIEALCAILTTCVMLSCASSALAETPRISAFVDLTNADEIGGVANDLNGSLDGAKGPVFLDLRIRPRIVGGRPEYGVVRTDSRARPRQLRCSEILRFGGATRQFNIGFNPVYNHLLLTVVHASGSQAPFNMAACESSSASGFDGDGNPVQDFVIRGYFAVTSLGIPTANDIVLHPVSPAFPP